MDPPSTIPPGLRNPADVFFQKDVIRRAILAAYWAAIILALPLWWHTTSIERLPLPQARVSQQVDVPIAIPVHICLQGTSHDFASRLQAALRAQRTPRWEALDVSVTSGECERFEEDTYVVSPASDKLVRGRQLMTFLDEIHFDALVETLSSLIAPDNMERQRQTRVAHFASRYRLAFSLLNEDANSGNSVASWNVRKGLHDQIQPILDVLSPLHNFTIESQVQFYAPLAFNPVRHTENAGFGLTYEDLTVFVNSAEWTLSSSVSNDPVLHFILFIPSASHSPLNIVNSDGTLSKSTAFLLPQWGGIAISNSPQTISAPELPSDRLNHAFSVFSSQLLKLLGIPELPAGVRRAPEDAGLISDWQLDALTRRRILETAKGTQDTLRSFIKLANQIENMPVGEVVRSDIEGALNALEKLYKSASASLSQSFTHSSEAFNLASRAFFNPGMLALLYFPAEHKYAVYTPLFASAVIPLFVAALREFLSWKKQRIRPSSTAS